MASGDPITIKLDGLAKASSMLEYTEKVKSTGVVMQCPVRLGLKKDGSDLWTIPLEPIVHVRGANAIIRRNIAKAKGRGTVKEQWSQEDYEIRIEGLLQGAGSFPEDSLSKIQSFVAVGQSVTIRAKLLDVLGINLIAIATIEYPGTPGLENQRYVITAHSDQYFDLT